MKSLRVGDIVHLTSGGPAMTVLGSSTEGYLCIWVTPKPFPHLAADEFPVEMLVRDDDLSPERSE